jgi:hypothetical protein
MRGKKPGFNAILAAIARACCLRLSRIQSLDAAVAGIDDKMSLAAAVAARIDVAPVLGSRAVDAAGTVVIAERAVIDITLSAIPFVVVLPGFASRPPLPVPLPSPLPIVSSWPTAALKIGS